MAEATSAHYEGSAGNRRFVYIMASIAALGGLLFGFDTGVISGALLFIRQDFGLNAFTEGFIVSSLLLGAMVGAGVSGALSDRLGRRTIILIAAVIFAVGAIGAALSPSVETLIFFRFVLGLGVGTASALVPSYISESAPTDVRGSLSSLFQLAITVGILIAYLVNAVFAPVGDWRWPLGLAFVPALVLFVGSPELSVIGENRAADSPLKRAKEPVKQYQHAFKVRERDVVRLFGILPTAHHRKFGRARCS